MPGPAPLPYKVACLCDLRDKDNRVLMLHRVKPPNSHLYSPIGGKLDVAIGESPTVNAQREILEEAGLDIPIERLHLGGIVSEAAFEGRSHWLMFYYRVLGPVWVEPREMREGRLEWYTREEIDALDLPVSDREIIWPLIRKHDVAGANDATNPRRPGFFAVHIDCTGPEMRWRVEQEFGVR